MGWPTGSQDISATSAHGRFASSLSSGELIWRIHTAAAFDGSFHRSPADAWPSSSARRFRNAATSATACAFVTSPFNSPACTWHHPYVEIHREPQRAAKLARIRRFQAEEECLTRFRSTPIRTSRSAAAAACGAAAAVAIRRLPTMLLPPCAHAVRCSSNKVA